MRSMLNLALRLPGGEITIPVGLAAATRRGGVKFRQLHRPCMTPVEERTWCPTHGEEVTGEELVKAWEVAAGEFVPVEDEELEGLVPQPASSVELAAFVDAAEISPPLVDRSYFLKPRAEQLGQRSYLLLRAALEQTGTVAIGRLAAWKKEYACAVRPLAGDSAALLLQTLHWAEDLVPGREIDLELAEGAIAAEELELAGELVRRYGKPLAQVGLESAYRPAERALLERKLAEGAAVTVTATVPVPPAPAFDLSEALKRSIRSAPRQRRTRARTAA